MLVESRVETEIKLIKKIDTIQIKAIGKVHEPGQAPLKDTVLQGRPGSPACLVSSGSSGSMESTAWTAE